MNVTSACKGHMNHSSNLRRIYRGISHKPLDLSAYFAYPQNYITRCISLSTYHINFELSSATSIFELHANREKQTKRGGACLVRCL